MKLLNEDEAIQLIDNQTKVTNTSVILISTPTCTICKGIKEIINKTEEINNILSIPIENIFEYCFTAKDKKMLAKIQNELKIENAPSLVFIYPNKKYKLYDKKINNFEDFKLALSLCN
jgi:hypothetical protein